MPIRRRFFLMIDCRLTDSGCGKTMFRRFSGLHRFILALVFCGGIAHAEPIELPYREFVGPDKARLLLIGSSHGPVADVSGLAESTMRLLEQADLVILEHFAPADATAFKHRSAKDYLSESALAELDQMASRDAKVAVFWRAVRDLPSPPELAGMLLMGRCEEVLKLPTNGGRQNSLDMKIVAATQHRKAIHTLETMQELDAFRSELGWNRYEQLLKASMAAAVNGQGCSRVRTNIRATDSLLRERRLNALLSEQRDFDCSQMACIGPSQGHLMGESRNTAMARKILAALTPGRTVLVALGALHLAQDGGLVDKLAAGGLTETSTNITDDVKTAAVGALN